MVYKMPNKRYHARPEIGSSSLKTVLRSLLHYEQAKSLDGAALDFGTACHTAILEADKFNDEIYISPSSRPTLPDIVEPVIVMPDEIKVRRGKAWEAFLAEHPTGTILNRKQWDWYHIKKSGKTIISDSEAITLSEMQNSWGIRQHTAAKELLDDPDGKAELSFFWEDTSGLQGKCRPDWWIPNKRIIIDYKTCQDASYWAFKNTIKRLHYDLSAAWYIRGVKAETGVEHRFIWIAQEKTMPYAIGMYEANEETLLCGEAKALDATEGLFEALQTGYYPGYLNVIQTI